MEASRGGVQQGILGSFCGAGPQRLSKPLVSSLWSWLGMQLHFLVLSCVPLFCQSQCDTTRHSGHARVSCSQTHLPQVFLHSSKILRQLLSRNDEANRSGNDCHSKGSSLYTQIPWGEPLKLRKMRNSTAASKNH